MFAGRNYDLHPHVIVKMQLRHISETEVDYVLTHFGANMREGIVESDVMSGRRLVVVLEDMGAYSMVTNVYWKTVVTN